MAACRWIFSSNVPTRPKGGGVTCLFTCTLLALNLLVAPIAQGQDVTSEELPGSEQITPTDESEVPAIDPVTGEPISPEDLEEEDQGPVDVYTVTDIPVDVTAATTTAAREQAFLEGQRTGLTQLGEQLGIPAFDLTVQRLSDEDIEQLVRSFSVSNERTLPGRYIADMTFVYEPEAMRALLREGRVNTAQSVDNSRVVIIPVFDGGQGSGPRLWDPPNPWFDAWLNFDPTGRNTEILVPYGDLLDVSDLSVEAAVAADTTALASLVSRYGAGRSVVAVATPEGNSLSVSLSAVSLSSLQAIDTVVAPLSAGRLDSGAMQQAVRQVADRIDTGLFLAGLPPGQEPTRFSTGGNASSLTVSVPINVPSDWYQISQTLSQLPIIVGETLLSLGPREAILRIEHLGSEDQLRAALEERTLSLQSNGGVPELRALNP